MYASRRARRRNIKGRLLYSEPGSKRSRAYTNEEIREIGELAVKTGMIAPPPVPPPTLPSLDRISIGCYGQENSSSAMLHLMALFQVRLSPLEFKAFGSREYNSTSPTELTPTVVYCNGTTGTFPVLASEGLSKSRLFIIYMQRSGGYWIFRFSWIASRTSSTGVRNVSLYPRTGDYYAVIIPYSGAPSSEETQGCPSLYMEVGTGEYAYRLKGLAKSDTATEYSSNTYSLTYWSNWSDRDPYFNMFDDSPFAEYLYDWLEQERVN